MIEYQKKENMGFFSWIISI